MVGKMKKRILVLLVSVVFVMLLSCLYIVNSSKETSTDNVKDEYTQIVKYTDTDIIIGTTKNEEQKLVCLTFDDGPSENTRKVASILKENGIQATFFMIGSQITGETEDIVKQLYKDGNQIGVHTYSHDASCIYCTEDTYYEDVIKTEECLVKILGITPLIYRFPWGSDNCYIRSYRSNIIKRLRNKNLEYCDWNVSGEDSVGSPSAATIFANVRANYKKYNEPVVLLHDSAVNNETVKALPDIIKLYKDAGYEFGTLNDRSKLLQWKKIT